MNFLKVTKHVFWLLFIKKDLNQGVLAVKSFVAAVLYTTNQNNAIVLDFITVTPNLRYKGYGPFIMHFAQAFAKVECVQLSKTAKDINDPFTTYLCCRHEIKRIYKNIYFKSVNQSTINKQVKSKLFSNRMNLKALVKSS